MPAFRVVTCKADKHEAGCQFRPDEFKLLVLRQRLRFPCTALTRAAEASKWVICPKPMRVGGCKLLLGLGVLPQYARSITRRHLGRFRLAWCIHEAAVTVLRASEFSSRWQSSQTVAQSSKRNLRCDEAIPGGIRRIGVAGALYGPDKTIRRLIIAPQEYRAGSRGRGGAPGATPTTGSDPCTGK